MEKLTKYEITRILSARAEQIAYGAPPLVRSTKEDTAYILAEKEYLKKTIPLAVIRDVNGERQIISVN
ncbi:DNA-directed RNA polymerase subunit K [archaeon]|nr:DNA-directed RNA polymerase subunit K [archaeon]NCP79687.1 DNA-directed RNA polymerase subunit K [archaeon]NCP97977.1 DNA-directed RNA polymerase subunit K [archaeon]NCQ07453.1 DNA-directed RNA polymerase subunit K [archaeon]NCQ51244.1 DNA-directed RNA polymerase subunit K [archaeon]